MIYIFRICMESLAIIIFEDIFGLDVDRHFNLVYE